VHITDFLFFQMNPVEAASVKKQQERETLRSVIAQWNANRLDLFELSEPNEVSVQ
jgi:afadin